jgi:hypothetical protein
VSNLSLLVLDIWTERAASRAGQLPTPAVFADGLIRA